MNIKYFQENMWTVWSRFSPLLAFTRALHNEILSTEETNHDAKNYAEEVAL